MSATNFTKGVNHANKLFNRDNVKTSPVFRTQVVPITAPADGSETATGFTLPTDAIVTNVWLRVRTAEATGTTKTIDVGTDSGDSGDADGFLDGVSVASTGLVKGTLATGSETLGALLTAESEAGTTDATVPESDIASGGKEMTYTAGSADFAELEADIIVEFYEIADR